MRFHSVDAAVISLSQLGIRRPAGVALPAYQSEGRVTTRTKFSAYPLAVATPEALSASDAAAAAAAAAFAAALRPICASPRLCQLSLSGASVGDAGIVLLCHALQHAQSLKEIDVRWRCLQRQECASFLKLSFTHALGRAHSLAFAFLGFAAAHFESWLLNHQLFRLTVRCTFEHARSLPF
eukprot:6183966-Pleurochrysis_carterae.AAC.3